MGAVARPIENSTFSINIPGSSACGGPMVGEKVTKQRRRYYDSDYEQKVKYPWLPKLMMPYRTSTVTELANAAPRPTGSSLVHYPSCFGGVYDPGSDNQDTLLAQARAASDLFERIGSLDTFDLGLALAEGKKTIGLIANTATRIARSYAYLKKGRIKEVFTTLGILEDTKLTRKLVDRNGKRLENAGEHRRYLQREFRKKDAGGFAARSWLELTYGWTPLLYDIDGAAEKLATYLHQNYSDVTVTGKGEQTRTYNVSTSSRNHSGRVHVQCKWAVELKVINDALRLKTSLGLTNPASIAWELVPFSFVVDWFIPFGAWIDGLSVLNGYSIVQKSRATKKTMFKYSETTAGETFVKPGFTSHRTYIEETLDRVINVNPTLRSPFFDMGAKLGVKRFTSALSLLKVVFGKHHL